MKKLKFQLIALGMLASGMALQSCSDDNNNNYYLSQPSAVVTVIPTDDSFVLKLDDNTTLHPANIKAAPFGEKEVRALVNYDELATESFPRQVNINWIDSIRTKEPVVMPTEDINEVYGNDPIEIMRDWVTVAEDGYLTLRVRTVWGDSNKIHSLNLVAGVNPENPNEFELRHNAHGDNAGRWGDSLIAFNLNKVLNPDQQPVKITVRWKSFSGEKSTDFDLYMRKPIE